MSNTQERHVKAFLSEKDCDVLCEKATEDKKDQNYEYKRSSAR